MTHYHIVEYLVELGADIQKGNYNGGTCLINSVQSPDLCLFLLEKGAQVNAKDVQNKTALHYAIQVCDLQFFFNEVRIRWWDDIRAVLGLIYTPDRLLLFK